MHRFLPNKKLYELKARQEFLLHSPNCQLPMNRYFMSKRKDFCQESVTMKRCTEHKEGSYQWISSSVASSGVPVYGGLKKAWKTHDSWLQKIIDVTLSLDLIIFAIYARGKSVTS